MLLIWRVAARQRQQLALSPPIVSAPSCAIASGPTRPPPLRWACATTVAVPTGRPGVFHLLRRKLTIATSSALPWSIDLLCSVISQNCQVPDIGDHPAVLISMP